MRRETAACFPSQSTLGDQSGSRHWITWCIMSPVTTARCPREKMLTQQWQGECPGVGVNVDGVVERIIIVDQERLACFNDRQAIVPEYRAGRIGAFRVFRLPRRIFAFVENVFRIRKCRHPAAIA